MNSEKKRAKFRVGSVFAFSAISITLLTFVIAKFTQSVTKILPSFLISSVEPADRVILFSWWAFGLLLISFAFFNTTRMRNVGTDFTEGSTSGVYIAGLIGAIVYSSYVWDFDILDTDNIIRTGQSDYFLGIVILSLLCLLALSSNENSINLSKFLTVLGSFLMFPILWQAPNGVRDAYHFLFTSDELAAVAAGKFPLSDYIPQYSNLLSFPVAPFLKFFSSSEMVVMIWLFLLQIFCLAIPTTIAIKLTNWSIAPLTFLLVWLPAVATGDPKTLNSASTYFAAMPIRYVGPIALLGMLLLWIKQYFINVRNVKSPTRSDLLLGICIGLVVLNNPDFGAPAAAAARSRAPRACPTRRPPRRSPRAPARADARPGAPTETCPSRAAPARP